MSNDKLGKFKLIAGYDQAILSIKLLNFSFFALPVG